MCKKYILDGEHYIHESGYLSNLSPNYEDTIKVGLLKKREEADKWGKRAIDAIIDLADRYKEQAEKEGRDDIVKVLEASNNLHLIDPKINLRVNKDTPMEIYELGSKLTKAGVHNMTAVFLYKKPTFIEGR